MYYTRKLCKKYGEMSGENIFINRESIKNDIQKSMSIIYKIMRRWKNRQNYFDMIAY